MTDPRDTKAMNRPVFVKNGDWYVLQEGNSHIRAFRELFSGFALVDYGHKEEVVDRPFDDYKAEVSWWADIRE